MSFRGGFRGIARGITKGAARSGTPSRNLSGSLGALPAVQTVGAELPRAGLSFHRMLGRPLTPFSIRK